MRQPHVWCFNDRPAYQYCYKPEFYNWLLVFLKKVYCWCLFQQFIACNNPTQSPALFQNIFKFCTFLSKFSKLSSFFALFKHFFALFCSFSEKTAHMPYFLEQALTVSNYLYKPKTLYTFVAGTIQSLFLPYLSGDGLIFLLFCCVWGFSVVVVA